MPPNELKPASAPRLDPATVVDPAPSGLVSWYGAGESAKASLRGVWTRLWGDDRSRDELEFLPSALEILETPASPTARTVMLVLASFFTLALGWAAIGEVDVVAVAQGKLVPTTGVKTIQPLEIGVVRAIHVRDGQEVKAGDLLLELDPTESEVDKGQVTRELLAAKVEYARLMAHLRMLDRGVPTELHEPEGADPNVVLMHRKRLESDILSFKAEIATLEGEQSRRLAEREAIKTEIRKLTQTIPLIEGREQGISDLYHKGVAPKPQWLELKQLLIESRENLEIQRHKLAEADAGLKTTMMQMEKAKAEAQKEVLSSIVEAEDKIKAADLQLRKAARREIQQRLRAPVGGYVQQLQVHTIGGVVQPAQILMVLVPKEAVLEVEAMVLNKDRGFVEEGQTAEVKLESFPFTKYGTIAGTVTSVSGDAIEDEKLGLVYAARASMAQPTIEADGRTVRLGPGMAATIEIKTGKRRIIEYVMAPLLRYKDESLRER